MENLDHLQGETNKRIYAQVLLGVLRYVPIKERYDEQLYEEELRKKLKFKQIGDDKTLRSCIDLLEDTEDALIEFYRSGLSTVPDHKQHMKLGEMYLRLYGVLNRLLAKVKR